MLMLSGFGGPGLGDAISDCNNASNTEWDYTTNTCIPFVGTAQDVCNANPAMYWDSANSLCVPAGSASSGSGSGSGTATAASGASVPWYQSIFTGVAAGATSALIPKPGMPLIPVATAPWYTTTTGMGAIAVAVLIGAYILTKK